MKRDRIINFRATAHDEERLAEMAQKTGGTISEVLRQLVSSAELRPCQTLRPVAHLTNSNASGSVLADSAGITR